METAGVHRLTIPIARNGQPPGLSDVTEVVHNTNTGETKKSTRRSRASSRAESAHNQHQPLNQQPQQQQPQQSNQLQQKQAARLSTPSFKEVSEGEQVELKERVRSMFIRNYDAYMKHAYPKVSAQFIKHCHEPCI
jgi:Ni/Co efflux regulator RcnB